jgi:hypothetical protein
VRVTAGPSARVSRQNAAACDVPRPRDNAGRYTSPLGSVPSRRERTSLRAVQGSRGARVSSGAQGPRCRDRTSLPVDGDRQDQMPQAAGAIACSGSWSLPVVANRPGVDQMIMRGLSQARLVAGVGRGAP